MEPTLEPIWAVFKATWKWIAGGGLLYLIGRPLADAAAEWWRDRIARGAELRRKRAEVVDGLLERLTDWHRALLAAAGVHVFDEGGYQDLQRAEAAEEETRRYIATRRHYLPQPTLDTIETVCRNLRGAWAGLGVRPDGRDRPRPMDPKYAQIRRKGEDLLRKQLPPLMDELREEFRRLVEGRRRRGH